MIAGDCAGGRDVRVFVQKPRKLAERHRLRRLTFGLTKPLLNPVAKMYAWRIALHPHQSGMISPALGIRHGLHFLLLFVGHQLSVSFAAWLDGFSPPEITAGG